MSTTFKILLTIFLLLMLLISSQFHFDIPIERLKEKYTDQHSRFIDVPEHGCSVHYRDQGSGPALVLLHGTASSLHTWEAWTGQLSKVYRVIRLDLPAFGLTGPRKDRDYSINAYVEFLSAFLDSLNVDHMHLAGNSFGGRVAWEYALANPQRVNSLILVDASGFDTGKPPSLGFRLARMPLVNSLLLKVTPRSLVSRSVYEVYGDDDKVTEDLINRYFDMLLREGNRQAFIDRANQSYDPPGDRLAAIKVPTLILWGKVDDWIPAEHAQKFLIQIPNSAVTIYSGVGHLPMEEVPYKSAKSVREFLGSVVPETEFPAGLRPIPLD